jgi:hypothetical protein
VAQSLGNLTPKQLEKMDALLALTSEFLSSIAPDLDGNDPAQAPRYSGRPPFCRFLAPAPCVSRTPSCSKVEAR